MQSRAVTVIKGALVLVAVLFGALTIISGIRVLLGADPGYVVFRPLVVYNAVMGVAYIVAGVFAWRNLNRGKYLAGGIFTLNLIVLGATGYLYNTGADVALMSVRAMTLRTVVWLVLFAGFAWLSRTARK